MEIVKTNMVAKNGRVGSNGTTLGDSNLSLPEIAACAVLVHRLLVRLIVKFVERVFARTQRLT